MRASVDAARAVVLEIEDDGDGIAEGLDASVWTPLFTTKKKGTGLGLSIVASILRRHRGEITFERRREGGTRFRVVVPPAS